MLKNQPQTKRKAISLFLGPDLDGTSAPFPSLLDFLLLLPLQFHSPKSSWVPLCGYLPLDTCAWVSACHFTNTYSSQHIFQDFSFTISSRNDRPRLGWIFIPHPLPQFMLTFLSSMATLEHLSVCASILLEWERTLTHSVLQHAQNWIPTEYSGWSVDIISLWTNGTFMYMM